MLPFPVQEFIAHVSSRDVSEVSERDRRSIFAWINTCLDPSTPYLDRTNAVVYQQGQVIDFTRESKFLPLGILSKQVSIVWNYSDYAVTCSLNVALDHIDELWLPGTEDVFIISIADHWLIEIYHEGDYFLHNTWRIANQYQFNA